MSPELRIRKRTDTDGVSRSPDTPLVVSVQRTSVYQSSGEDSPPDPHGTGGPETDGDGV